MAYNKRVPVNITLSKKLVKKIKEYKKIHPEFNLSRYIESLLLRYPSRFEEPILSLRPDV